MVYSEFKRHLGKAGLTVNEFASLLNIKSSSVTNHSISDKVPNQLTIIAVLMGEMADNGLDFREPLKKIADTLVPIKPKVIGKFGGDKQERLKI